jgi:hypothetical protein
MTTSRELPTLLSSFAFEEKNQEMTTSWGAHCCLLHLKEKPRNDDKLGGLSSFATRKKKNKKMTMS